MRAKRATATPCQQQRTLGEELTGSLRRKPCHPRTSAASPSPCAHLVPHYLMPGAASRLTAPAATAEYLMPGDLWLTDLAAHNRLP